MKTFIATALIVLATSAGAVEVVNVLEAKLPAFRFSNYTNVDTTFQVDRQTGEGFVKVVVTEERYRSGRIGPCRSDLCAPGPFEYGPQYFVIFNKTVKVRNLNLVDNKLVYHSEMGEVDCGTLGVSRVFKRPTLYLSGKCDVEGKVVKTADGRSLVVTLATK